LVLCSKNIDCFAFIKDFFANSQLFVNLKKNKGMTAALKSNGIRKRIYVIMDTEQENPDLAAWLFEFFITALIILSVVSIIAESFIDNRYAGSIAEWTERMERNKSLETYFNYFELFTLLVFTFEYFLRIVTADYRYPNEKNWMRAAWRFMKSGGGIIDFIAISPFVFHLANVDFRFLRALKISRLLRVFKLNALTRSVGIVGDVFVEKRNELGVTLFVTFIMLLVSSTLMWYVEGSVQPKAFPNIVATFWWAIATLTTVGYGDVYPITAYGKLLSGMIAVLGIGIVALPAGILSSAFIEKLEKEKEKKLAASKEDRLVEGNSSSKACASQFGQQFSYCPYCGDKLDSEGKHTHSSN
jgi:voltage-gated potassium channel